MHSNTVFDKNIPLFDKESNRALKKYIPLVEADQKWGFVVNDLGHTLIPENSEYPSKGHPGSHMFSWDSGRILHEFHFVLISEGKGVFESSSSGTHHLNKGDGFMIFPGEWHRYKPLRESGWVENWIGFTGSIADIVMQEPNFSKSEPVFRNCANPLIFSLFKSLVQLITDEPFGYQRTASGLCLQLLAELCNKQKGLGINSEINTIVSKAKYLMHNHINKEVDLHGFCNDCGISYSKFRSDFKKQTGTAPKQYFLLMKLEKAKDLLRSGHVSAKEIAFLLGFKTDHYFSRIFKLKTGVTPGEYRAMN